MWEQHIEMIQFHERSLQSCLDRLALTLPIFTPTAPSELQLRTRSD